MMTLGFVSNVTVSYFHLVPWTIKYLTNIWTKATYNKDHDTNNSNNLVVKPPPNLNSLLNQFNNSSKTHDFKDPKNIVKSKFFRSRKSSNHKIPNKKSSLSLFHINTCSLTKNFEDHKYLLKTTNTNFNIIAILETTILKNTNIIKSINIPNLSYEFTPTEWTAGGTLLYTVDHSAYQKINDLNLYKKN